MTEAALATASLFNPVAIKYNGYEYRFQDPSYSGFSNPTRRAIDEVRHLSSEHLNAVLSLGGGHEFIQLN